MLSQLIYHSRYRALETGVSATVRQILSASQRNNARNRVTGFLIFDKTHFLQILEGARSDVDRTYSLIARDPRHGELKIVAQREVSQRAFPDWAMGGCIRSADVQHIYDRYNLAEIFTVTSAGPDDIVNLAREISLWESDRKRTRGLSGY